MKKIVSLLLVAAMMLSICAFASAEGPVEITFWHAMGGVNGEAITAMIDDFNAQYEGKIKVNYEYQGAYDDAFAKIKAAGISSIPCDIMQVYDIGTRFMIDQGWAKPMQEFIDAEGFDASVIEPNIAAYYTVDGTLYSMPFNSSTPILYYNKTAFEKAGLDPNTPPKNFDEIYEMSKKITESGAAKYGFGMGNYGWFFEQWTGKMGKNYVNNNNGRGVDYATAVEFDSNGAGHDILSVWKKFVADEATAIAPYLNQGNDDAKQAFINGDIAITLESTAALKTLLTNVGDSFEIGVGFFPNINADDVGGVSVGGGSLWAFKTGDADREAATWEFVKFMTNPENQAFWNARTGYFPVNVKAQETEAFKANVAQYPQFQVALDQLHSSAPQYAGGLLAVFSQARALVQSYTEKLVHHEIEDVDECVKQLAAEINEAIEMYNLTNY